MNRIWGVVTLPIGIETAKGCQYEAEVKFNYTVTPRRSHTYWQPGDASTVEIDGAYVITSEGSTPAHWLADLLCDDGEVIGACLNDAEDRHQNNLEQQAEYRRELRDERGASMNAGDADAWHVANSQVSSAVAAMRDEANLGLRDDPVFVA